MFPNGAECHSGYIVYQDIVQSPETQNLKKHYDKDSNILDRSKVLTHTAEVLKQE